MPKQTLPAKLVEALLLPSWLSATIAIAVGLVLVIGPWLLFHYGSGVQQSTLGLSTVYHQSSLAAEAQAVSAKFLTNSRVGDTIFFCLWAAVGWVIYLVSVNIVKGLGQIWTLSRELHYVNIVRHNVIHEIVVRSAVRVVSIIAWWLLLRFLAYHLIPYSLAAMHDVVVNPCLHNWLTGLWYGLLCVLVVHGLTVLLRIMVLRPRLFGKSAIE
jgi:hypothetical protein